MKPKLPNQNQVSFANEMIEVLNAFKRGETIQRRGNYATDDKWEDFDLGDFFENPHIEYRVKPVRGNRK